MADRSLNRPPHDIRARPVCQFFLKTAERRLLFLIPILHQTTTITSKYGQNRRCFSFQFYIKPQHPGREPFHAASCFSFQFYIKPQPYFVPLSKYDVVSHSNSTSNHNQHFGADSFDRVVSHSNSTSNHNIALCRCPKCGVVSHSNSTSNHNLAHGSNSYSARYTYDTDA